MYTSGHLNGKFLNRIVVCVDVYIGVCIFGHVLFTQMESITTEQHIVSSSWLDSINQGSILFLFFSILF